MNKQNFTRKLRNLGISGFPASEPTTAGYRARLTAHRQYLYTEVLKETPKNSLVYYPGSGADPLPRHIFGPKIVYGSLRDSPYFEMLRGGPKNRPVAYEHIPGQIRKINGVYSDALHNPFGPSSVQVIINHYTSLALEDDYWVEVDRILRPGGLLIVGEMADVFWHDKVRTLARRHGFAVHSLDMSSKPVNTNYWGFPYGKNVKINGKGSMYGLCRNTFVSKLKNDEEVKMDIYLSHVFNKHL